MLPKVGIGRRCGAIQANVDRYRALMSDELYEELLTPHKRNPMICEAVLALSMLVLRSTPLALDAMIQDHERDWSSDHIEWAYLGEMCIMTDGALDLTLRVLTGLKINPQRMLENLSLLDGLALSEAVMLALGKALGRQTAHDLAYECAMRSYDQGLSFRQGLGEHPLVAVHLTLGQIDDLLDATHYTGLAGQLVDRVLAAVEYSGES